MSYPKGTLLRSFVTDDNTKHYTAVVYNDGKVLEIKNIEGDKKRTTFNSVEEWCQIRNISQESLQVDESKSRTDVKQTTTINGFHVRRNSYYMVKIDPQYYDAYIWTKWCYNSIVNYAPDLLENNELKELYNKMVEVCETYKDVYYLAISTTDYMKFKYLGKQNTVYYNMYNKSYNVPRIIEAQNEIMKYYTQIETIIKPRMEKQLENDYQVSRYKQNIRKHESAIKKAQKRIEDLPKKIEEEKESLERYIADKKKDIEVAKKSLKMYYS
jgi:hypothetical protein